jgi:hypothetical protein
MTYAMARLKTACATALPMHPETAYATVLPMHLKTACATALPTAEIQAPPTC